MPSKDEEQILALIHKLRTQLTILKFAESEAAKNAALKEIEETLTDKEAEALED